MICRCLLVSCVLGLSAGPLGAQILADAAPAVQAGPATAPAAAVAATPASLPEAAPPTGADVAPVVLYTAEQMPSFPGGDVALAKFLASKLQYPAAALDKAVSGKVHVSFVVDAEGRLRDPRVVRGLGHGLDEEALRLVRLMPFWNPGRVQGRPVWVSFTMPIVFRAL